MRPNTVNSRSHAQGTPEQLSLHEKAWETQCHVLKPCAAWQKTKCLDTGSEARLQKR